VASTIVAAAISFVNLRIVVSSVFVFEQNFLIKA
jgi:hypothetical protein